MRGITVARNLVKSSSLATRGLSRPVLTGSRYMIDKHQHEHPLTSIQLRKFQSSSIFFDSSSSNLDKTALYDFHVNNGAKMMPFAGFSMPIQYSGGPVAEHLHTRKAASLFDVSHMIQNRLTGETATKFLSTLCPTNFSSMEYSMDLYSASYSVLLNPSGGIIDDLIITRQGEDSYYIVTNAACREGDLKWINGELEKWNKSQGTNVTFETMSGQGLVALQGPSAAQALESVLETNLNHLVFGTSQNRSHQGHELHISRGGYTGEDGFEISVPKEFTQQFTEQLAAHSEVNLAGLAARDSLRLEAGLCLYGNDLDQTTTPVEAALSWVVAKDRRAPGEFLGVDKVLEHLQNGPPRRRVGLAIEGSPARTGVKIYDESGKEELGVVTSGIPSPSLGKNIAMGYVKNGQHKKGTQLKVSVRGKMRDAVVEKMPFVTSKYFRG